MFSGDNGYFNGVHFFDMTALFLLQFKEDEGLHKSLLMFFCGMAFYNLIKPLFTDPTIADSTDYYYFFAGLTFVFIQYAYKRFTD